LGRNRRNKKNQRRETISNRKENPRNPNPNTRRRLRERRELTFSRARINACATARRRAHMIPAVARRRTHPRAGSGPDQNKDAARGHLDGHALTLERARAPARQPRQRRHRPRHRSLSSRRRPSPLASSKKGGEENGWLGFWGRRPAGFVRPGLAPGRQI